MLLIETLGPFFRSHGLPLSTTVVLNRRSDQGKDEILHIVEINGPPMTDTEDAYDNAAILVRSRGPRNDAVIARNTAHIVDRIMLDPKLRPYDLGGSRVLSSGRLGGGPAFFEIDTDSRTIYMASYWITNQR